MKFLNKYSDKTLRVFIVIITLYCFFLSGIPLYKAAISERLTIDDSRKEHIKNDNNENQLKISEILPGGVSEEAGLKVGDIIVSVNGVKFQDYKGMGLGLEDENVFDENLEETELNINSNNIFLLYSDGLTEAMNRKKEEYGTERVLSILKDNKDQPVRSVQEKIINSVNNFRQNSEQNYDITFVVVKVK